ncbi:hypothetical protein PHMEG_0007701 [Phytophthora megakarya]|uniref:Uncharacterized protein n=1 Tax=Phytophthora megakarya TaxID=4795 RepID=A0A225WMN2_9STRA|nr:hypothetical protein PHMEG_0007701 [Phytophthora megakarya]
MEHLLNDAPDEADEVSIKTEIIKTEATETPLPHLAAQLSTVASPSSSAASLGLQMLSVSAPRPTPRLPPISLLTAAAAALQPMQCHPIQVQAPPQTLRPVLPPLPPSPPSNQPPPADDMLCRYRNKKCGYPRAIKRNGERHNLCERHRAKANQNQRKLESKRRQQKRLNHRAHAMGERVVKAKKVSADAETEIKFTMYGGAIA